MKIRLFFMALSLLICTAGRSQNTSESAIIISEENLISILKKIIKKRDYILLEDDKKSTPQNSPNIKTTSPFLPEFNPQQQDQLNAIYAKLETLEYDIKLLNTSLSGRMKTTPKKGASTIVTTPGNVATTYTTIQAGENKTDARYAEQISELEKKIITLKENAKEQLLAQEKQDNLTRSNKNYDEATRILNSKQTSIDTIIIEKRETSEYPELVKKFDSFQSKIFFDNNSKTITENHTKSLNEIITILKSTEKIDVYLKGFASNKGNPVYNQNLSVQRTENVKKYLIKNGIHPSRILTQYHGIDYSATNEALARRVDLSFIIRK